MSTTVTEQSATWMWEELNRLTQFLHSIQRHPDYVYCVTLEDSTAHKSLDGWERNAALVDAYHGTAGGEQYRQASNPSRPREFYWMCKVTS